MNEKILALTLLLLLLVAFFPNLILLCFHVLLVEIGEDEESELLGLESVLICYFFSCRDCV